MPAVSEAQRRYLYATFGPSWVHNHHFDNKGPLPPKVGGRPAKPDPKPVGKKKKRVRRK